MAKQIVGGKWERRGLQGIRTVEAYRLEAGLDQLGGKHYGRYEPTEAQLV